MRPSGRIALAGLGAAILALLAPGRLLAGQELSSAQMAFLLHDGVRGRGAVAAVGALLRDQYGYQREHIVESGRESTRDSIDAELNGLLDDARGSKQFVDAFVFISVPVNEESTRVVFRPGRSSAEAPWAWLTGDALSNWITSFPLRSALLIHRACTVSGESLADQLFQRRGGSAGAIAVLIYCPIGSSTAGPSKEEFEAAREAVAQGLVDTLRDGPAHGRTMDSRALTERLRTRLRGIEFRLQEVSSAGAPGFTFVAVGGGGQRPQQVLDPAMNDAERREALQSLVLQANKDPNRFTTSAVRAAEELARADDVPLPTRQLALDALASLEADAGGVALGRLARDATVDPVLRQAALSLAIRRRDVGTVRALLRDPDPVLRAAALRASGALGDEAAADAWVEGLAAEGNPAVQIAALQNLATLHREVDRPRFMAPTASADPNLRAEALLALGRLPPDDAMRALLVARLRDDSDSTVRRAAAYALGRGAADSAHPQAEDALIAALRDPSEAVRHAAAFALGEMRTVRAAPDLAAAMARNDEVDYVQVAAAEALGKIRLPESIDVLVAASNSKWATVRRAAVTALGAIDGGSTIPPLIERLRDPDPFVRHEAWQVVDAINPVERALIDRYLEDTSELVREVMVRKLAAADAQDVVVLLRILDDPALPVRAAAAQGLARYKEDALVAAIAAALADPSPRRREGAAWALGQIQTEPARAALLQAAESPEAPARHDAIRALGHYKDPTARAVLDRAIDDKTNDVRRAVAEALRESASTDASTKQLERLANDPSQAVKQTAIDGLRRGPASIPATSPSRISPQ